MAPEQAEGRTDRVGPPTDVWAIGVMLYELVLGQRPFEGETSEDVKRLIVQAEVIRPSVLKPGIDRTLEAILLACLEKDPRRRYPSAGKLAVDLRSWLDGDPTWARPDTRLRRLWRAVRRHPRKVVVTLVLLLGMVGAEGYIQFTDPDRPVYRIESQLRRGERAVLIGETGKPVWWRWQTPECRVVRGLLDPSEAFAFECSNNGLLELLSDPQTDAYRYAAEINVKFVPYGRPEAGIYFAYGLEQELRVFCMLTFSDHAGGAPSAPNDEDRYAEFSLRACPDVLNWHSRHMARRAIRSQLPLSEHWHKVSVVVTPERVQLFWEDELISEISRADFLAEATRFFMTPPGLPGEPRYRPRGALGIYLREGQAAFRRVTVEPLDHTN
jgi:hypothetical protein